MVYSPLTYYKNQLNVGKYTNPMDFMGFTGGNIVIWACIATKPLIVSYQS